MSANKDVLLAPRLAVLIIFAATLVGAQIDTPQIPPELDVRDLYQRAAASAFVITGTIEKDEGVTKRMTPDLLDKVKAEGDLSLAIGGTLYTILVENTICRQTDFGTETPSGRPAGQLGASVHMFLPRTSGAYANEQLLTGQRYLLFLVIPSQQKEWTTTFQLDPNLVYYRSQEGYRGAVRLPKEAANAPIVLDKVTRLCQAVRPANVAEKIAALKRLATSGDPLLEKEATTAAKALQASPGTKR